jgi:AraC-like DNA-binding protein
MPSSAVHIFTDPDDYAATIRQGTVEMTVTGRGHLNAKLTRIDLHRLWMQRFSENLPAVYHVAGWDGRAVIAFRTQPGPNLLRGGQEMYPTDIMRQPRDPTLITPPQAAMAKLQRLHAAAGELAENAPEIIANPDAARGSEQALIEAMVACLGHHDGRENSLAQGQHALVMRRFRRVVEENQDQPLYIPDICKAIGVSESTLRMCCQEHLGMSPKRYLLLRRMALTRRALRQAEPDATSVTATATRYGFWELGRFAVWTPLKTGSDSL